MVKVEQAGKFNQQLHKIRLENPELEIEIDQRTRWFQKNPQDTRLNNHPLTKRMEGKWAFSVTDDIRIVYKWVGKTTVRFLAIGSHHQVYN